MSANQLDTIDAVLKKHGLRDQIPFARDAGGVDWRNPLTEMIEAEDAACAELLEEAVGMGERMIAGLRARLPDGELKREICEHVTRKVGREAQEQFHRYHAGFIEWLFAAGVHPLEVVKRLYCYVKLKRPDLLHNLGFRPLGELLGEGGGANAGAAMQARCKALFGPLAVGAHKSATAKAAMTKAQKGNRNRRGGK